MLLRLFAALLLAFVCSRSVRATPASRLLWLSDIHFDPFTSPALVDKLAASPIESWPEILGSASERSYPSFGQDTNWPLLSSALRAIRLTQPKPSFAIVTGDLLGHHFRDSFNRTASDHSDAAFRQFVRKTFTFVGKQLQSSVSGSRVLLALGNNDDVCGDYMLQPEGPFLRDTTSLVTTLAGITDTSSFEKDWNALGSFSVPISTIKNHLVVSLNTNFFSPKYSNRCGSDSSDLGDRLLVWLEQRLAGAERKGQIVWLVYHMPPGIDGFASTRRAPDVPPVLLWKTSYTDRFESLLDRYGKSIQLNFAGHTHGDDFRLFGRGSKTWVGVEPALSPVYNQNPAFRIVDVDGKGAITNQSTYFLDLAQRDATPEWKLEYQFCQAWGFRRVDAAAYRRLWQRVASPGKDRDQWMAEYSAQHKGAVITESNFFTLFCASAYIAPKDYRACTALSAPR